MNRAASQSRSAAAARCGLLATVLLASPATALHAGEAPALPGQPSACVQSALLDPGRALFVPTHPRVATTIRFPGAIGAPEGRGFTEDEAKRPGEYLVTWTPGDCHVTLTPLRGAGPLNLNVPYQGKTYVFYLYPAASQFEALASLNLEASGAREGKTDGAGVPAKGSNAAAAPAPVSGSPGRWMGLLDKVKIMRAAAPGGTLRLLAAGLGLECADIAGTAGAWPAGARAVPVAIRVLRVVKDPRLNALGFAVELRNVAATEVSLDGSSLAARCGSVLISQRLADAPSRLSPGAAAEAYFVGECPAGNSLSVDNDWTVSIAQLAPRRSPCAAWVEEFGSARADPKSRKGAE